MDFFVYLKEIGTASLWDLQLRGSMASPITEFCKYYKMKKHIVSQMSPSNLFNCYILLLLFSRNATYVSPQYHKHIPEPPEGVIIPPKVFPNPVRIFFHSIQKMDRVPLSRDNRTETTKKHP